MEKVEFLKFVTGWVGLYMLEVTDYPVDICDTFVRQYILDHFVHYIEENMLND